MSGAVANTLWARSFVDELARIGVRDVIIAPGSRSTPLVMAFAADARFHARVHLDERSASFFALGVGKATGRPAAVLTTSGTAVANCFPAVVEASQSGVPLLVLTADRPHRHRGADANQAIDQVGIFGGYVRASFELAPPTLEGPALRHLRTLACRAHAAATGANAGPVHVNFPFDKPLEPVEVPDAILSEHPLAAIGRPRGAPFVDVRTGVSTPDAAVLDPLAERMVSERGVIVAGPSESARRLGPAVHRLATATGFPVLADALSGARFGPSGGAHVVAAYDLFLREEDVREALAPGLVVRVGASPTSASLLEWLLRHNGVTHVVVDEGGRWKDHGAIATDYLLADPVATLDRLAELVEGHGRRGGSGGAPGPNPWAQTWRRVEAAALAGLAGPRDDPGVAHEGEVMAAVLGALKGDTALVVSSSMPVRDLDAFGHPCTEPIRVHANRGASGIDGVVSTAFGVASRTDGPTVCVIGDIAFFHDQNGLLWSREPDTDVVFVVVDNDGGGIFHTLPIADHEPDFTRFFATPHGIDPRHAAAAHEIDYAEVAVGVVGTEVGRRLRSGGSAVLRVRTDRAANHRAHAEIVGRVAGSVREALG